MSTHGNISFAPYIHGTYASGGIRPSYRAEYLTSFDAFQWNKLVLNARLGNTTLLGTGPRNSLRLDRIRYLLAPGLRYDFSSWYIQGIVHHECIHTIDRPEEQYPGFDRGTVWWNSIRVALGSKGANFLYLRDEYEKPLQSFFDSWDVQLTYGKYILAENTIITGQNHRYRHEVLSRLRYHFTPNSRLAAFFSLDQSFWVKSDQSTEQKWSGTVHLFLRGTENFAGIFYTYHFFDTFSPDNEDGFGAIGFRIVF